ncbi:MAG: hypothetical protein FJ357_04310 [Thaumarchaeota archaeon]|nr:hypothetical protein [Nitrososphaerota archaeon]
MNLDELCQNVLKINEDVRFAGILDKNGQLVSGRYKDGLASHLQSNESKMSFHYASKALESRKNLSHRVGKEKFAIVEFEKVKLISVPVDGNNLLLVSVEPKTSHDQILDSVFTLLNSS